MRRREVRAAGLAAAVVAMAAAATAANGQTAPAASPPRLPEVAAIESTADAFMEALNTADVGKLAPLFAPDATAFFPIGPFAERLENKDQIVKVFGAFFESVRRGGAGPRYMNLVPEDVRLQTFGSTALLTFQFKGPEMLSRRTLLLRNDNGTWRIVHLHASNMAVQKR